MISFPPREENLLMTTRWPCLIVTVLCAVLFAATSASAECAWVLWEHAEQNSWWWRSHMLWTPLGAVATLSDCEKEAARHRQMGETLAKSEAKPAPYMAWRCLPDTVDPRGPKGK